MFVYLCPFGLLAEGVGRGGLLLPVHYLSEKWGEFFGHSFVLLETWMVASAVAQFARLE